MFVFFFLNLFIHLFLAVLGLRCCAQAFSRCSKGELLSFRCGDFFLIGTASLVEHGLWSVWAQHAGSVVAVHGLSCPATRGIFLDQGSNLCPLHWLVVS